MEYDVVIVGGGLAGLTAQAYLSKQGYKTLLLEKSSKVGGLVTTFAYKGYSFDGGIRAFENSGIIYPMLKSLGIKLDVIKNLVSIGIKDKRVILESRESLANYLSMLKELFPNNTADIDQIGILIKIIMGYMDVFYGIDNPIFLDNMYDTKYVFKTLLPWLVKYQINVGKASRLNKPVVEYLKKYTQNQELIDMITQHFFKSTPTFFAMSYFSLYLDYTYPIGGTGVLAQKMNEYIVQHGGKILTNAKVIGLDVNKNEVYTEDSMVSYKKLIWAADIKKLYSLVNNYDAPKFKKQKTQVLKSHGGDSIITLFIGVNLDKQYFEDKSGPHAFYTPHTNGLSKLHNISGQEDKYSWLNYYLNDTTYEISCPSLRDQNLAPQGKTSLIISTLMDYHFVKNFEEKNEYQKFKDYCTSTIIDVLNQTLFPNFKDLIEFSMLSTPLTIEKETGNSEGAITGWAFDNQDMPAKNRFKQIVKSMDTPIKDIFQCGQWSFSPSGLPVSVFTGKLAADKAIKELKSK